MKKCGTSDCGSGVCAHDDPNQLRTPPDSMRVGGLDCWDCHKASPNFMVHDEVWREAMPEYRELTHRLREFRHSKIPKERAKGYIGLCIPCLEHRLRRKLVPEDFNLELPINQTILLGLRMAREP